MTEWDAEHHFPAGMRYMFFVNWSEKVPVHILERAECVNFHCTALPYGRGGHPIENLLLAGKTDTVITAHQMTTAIDAGPIYAVSPSVSLSGTKREIQARFINPVSALIRQIIDTEPTPYAQHGEPTYFQRLQPETYEQFWSGRG